MKKSIGQQHVGHFFGRIEGHAIAQLVVGEAPEHHFGFFLVHHFPPVGVFLGQHGGQHRGAVVVDFFL